MPAPISFLGNSQADCSKRYFAAETAAAVPFSLRPSRNSAEASYTARARLRSLASQPSTERTAAAVRRGGDRAGERLAGAAREMLLDTKAEVGRWGGQVGGGNEVAGAAGTMEGFKGSPPLPRWPRSPLQPPPSPPPPAPAGAAPTPRRPQP